MKAIVKGSTLALRDVAAQAPGPGEVRVRVAYAGVCRTDLYVADDRLAAPLPRILGHELSGTTMDPAPGIAVGARVTVRPYLRCERCAGCSLPAPENAGEERAPCSAPARLGIERDGAFAEELVVPASMLLPLPDALSLRTAAFVEPVAAALAVLRAPLSPGGRGLVPGEHRIAELTRRVLALHGWNVEAASDGDVDFGVETSHAVIGDLIRRIRPRGVLVLKSRPFEPVAMDVGLLVAKEIQVAAVHYGSFASAIALLAEQRLEVADLFGPERALEDWHATFAEARREHAKKQLFTVAGGA